MKKTKSRFRGKVSKDVQRQQSAASSYGYLQLPKGVNVFSAKPGSRNVLLDILPYEVTDAKHPDRDDENEIAVPGTLWFKRPYWVHRNVGSGNDTAVCPLMSAKKPCPICEYRSKLQKKGADAEEIKALRPSKRNLYVVVPLNDREEEATPHIFDISDYNFQKLLNEEIQTDESYEVFPDLEEGLTLKVRFDASTIGNSKPYAEASRIDFKEREPYEESILDEVPNLDVVLTILPYDELNAKFFEVDTEEVGEDLEDEDDEEVKRPARKAKTSAPTRKPRHVEEEEEEDEEEEVEEDDDEEEEEEAPPRRKLASKTPAKTKPASRKTLIEEDEEEEEDDAEEEDEEEEEEEAPRRRLTRQKPTTSKVESTTGKKKCPYGHRFGIDCEDFKECETCKLWSDCLEEKQRR